MSRFTDSYEWHDGINCERKLESWLLSKGNITARVRHGGSLAPTLRAWEREIVLPDLQVMRPGESAVWLEVKYKSTCGWLEHRNIRTTGVDRPNWVHYCEVERLTGYPVWIAFCHREQDDVRLARASDDKGFPGVGAGSGMRYWSWDELRSIATFTEIMDSPTRYTTAAETPLFAPISDAPSLPGLEAA